MIECFCIKDNLILCHNLSLHRLVLIEFVIAHRYQCIKEIQRFYPFICTLFIRSLPLLKESDNGYIYQSKAIKDEYTNLITAIIYLL